VVPFQAWHLEWLNLQASQHMLSASLTVQYGRSLEGAGPCYSAFCGARVVACAGIVEFWAGRAQVWSLLAEEMPQYRKAIHRAVKGFLETYRVRRLECLVDPRSEPSMRWATHLGFHVEHLMRAYTPHGDDQLMYVRLE
jgi:RimJ/RimL family protein N-acetyltransferase